MKPRKKTNSFALALRLRARAAMLLIALLCGVTGAWADNLYLEVSDKSATLKYGDKGDNPYYDYSSGSVTMYWSGANDAKTSVTTINVHTTCASHGETNLENLFKDFTALTTINGLGNLKTTGVTNMAFMFNNCPELVTLDLSSWNTASVTNMSSMFNSCSKLANIYVGSGWSVENVTEDKGSNMFLNCTSLPGYTSSETGKSKAHTGEGGYLKTKSTTAVDLGLPSGTKWANMNVGATTETGIGTYFAWAATASQANYNWANTPYYTGDGSTHSWSKYTSAPATLASGDDAATQQWGSQWRMPTETEMEELMNSTYTTWTWYDDYNDTGVKGYLVSGKGDYSGNSIFLPLTGNMDGTVLKNTSYSFYWTSTLTANAVNCGRLLQFSSGSTDIKDHERYFGFPVRPVQMFVGEGTEGSPYLIASTTDWDNLVSAVNGGETYSGKYFKMTANVDVSTMIGSSTETFNGNFDGDGHTLNLSINMTSSSSMIAAPFAYVVGGTIKNVNLTGTVSTAGMHSSSLVGYADNCTIRNCTSSVAISTSLNRDIDGGAFVACVIKDRTVTIEGCAFTGSITFSDAAGYEGGGFVGWMRSPSTVTLTNCLFAPSAVSLAKASPDFKMFAYDNSGTTLTLNNCYYNDVAAAESKITAQGLQARSISKGTGVSELYNSGTPYIYYNVSGITAYTTGIKYAEVYYAGEGDAVSLTLGHEAASDGYAFGRYATTGGTITAQTETSASLTMPAANVTISAVYDPTYNATFASGNDNSGWTISPMQQTEGGTVTVSYEGENKVKSVTVTPKGALTGKFSVSSTKQVQFSKGNLQYVGTWQFAANQYYVIGDGQADNHRDLFGWGTKTNPNNTSTTNGDYSWAEWGENTITNGCTGWRTLSKEEWGYLFTDRTNASTLRTFATVNSVKGLIIMPDGWTANGVTLSITTANFTTNVLNTSQWATLEKQGCVFLPTAGGRAGTTVVNVGAIGDYWSSDASGETNAYDLNFSNNYLLPQNTAGQRHYGWSVRLVRDVE